MKYTVQSINNYCDFAEDKAYVLMLIPRKKENGENTEKDKLGLLQRKVVRNEAEVVDAIEYFESFTSRYPEFVFRLYCNVNRRDLVKGMFSVQDKIGRMVKDMHYGNVEVFDRLVKFSSQIKSALCEKACRDEKYFHFDVDFENNTEEGVREHLELLARLEKLTLVKWVCETLNGFAIITDPFNPYDLKKQYDTKYKPKSAMDIHPLIEIKTDSYLYFGVYNYKG